MTDTKGRPNHINDALAQMHPNFWYTYTDNKNQVYANLRLTPKIGVGGELVDGSNMAAGYDDIYGPRASNINKFKHIQKYK